MGRTVCCRLQATQVLHSPQRLSVPAPNTAWCTTQHITACCTPTAQHAITSTAEQSRAEQSRAQHSTAQHSTAQHSMPTIHLRERGQLGQGGLQEGEGAVLLEALRKRGVLLLAAQLGVAVAAGGGAGAGGYPGSGATRWSNPLCEVLT